MAKKATSTAVSTGQTYTDLVNMGQDGVGPLLERTIAKIKALTGGQSDSKETTKGVSLPGFGKVEDIKKVSTLIQALSSVRARVKAYEETANDLDISLVKFPFKLENITSKTWEAVIKKQIATLSNKAELDKLNAIKAKLEANLSAKDKLKKDMQDVADLLSSDSALE